MIAMNASEIHPNMKVMIICVWRPTDGGGAIGGPMEVPIWFANLMPREIN